MTAKEIRDLPVGALLRRRKAAYLVVERTKTEIILLAEPSNTLMRMDLRQWGALIPRGNRVYCFWREVRRIA